MTRARGPALTRRQSVLLLAGALAAVPLHGAAAVAERTLPPSHALPDELAAALAMGEPLLVMASLKGCPWCRLVRNNYLAPMHEQEGLPVVQVDFLSQASSRAFDGTPATHEALLRQWQVTVAPTVLFFGAGGQEIAPRLEGVSEDFYAAQLERRLRQARQTLRKSGSAAGRNGVGPNRPA